MNMYTCVSVHYVIYMFTYNICRYTYITHWYMFIYIHMCIYIVYLNAYFLCDIYSHLYMYLNIDALHIHIHYSRI